MKIAVVADKKAGHLSQCLGLREILKSYKKDKDLFILNKDIIAFPGFLERAFTLIYEKLYLFILRLLNPNLADRDFDLVICSGSRTAIPAYLLAKLSKAKIIYIGTPKYRIMKKFDGIVSTKTDLSSVYKVITTELPPTKFKPFKDFVEPVKQSLVLIGGDGSGYDYGESDWYRVAWRSTLVPLATGSDHFCAAPGGDSTQKETSKTTVLSGPAPSAADCCPCSIVSTHPRAVGEP